MGNPVGGGRASVGLGRDPTYVMEVESSGLADELARGRRKAGGREKNHMWLLELGLWSSVNAKVERTLLR